MRRPRPAPARARARPRARASRATTSTSARARLLRPAVTPPLRRRRRVSPEATPFQAMGVEIAVCGASDDELDAIRRLFEQWDGVFSRFRPDSELSRVNRHPLQVVILSRLFAYAMRAAISAAGATNGLVAPTVGAAVAAAGYDRDFSELGDDERPPGHPSPGTWRSLRLSGRLLSRPPGTELDLNGVVKSLAVDSALELISGDGFVAAGGDVAVRGGAPIALPAGGRGSCWPAGWGPAGRPSA